MNFVLRPHHKSKYIRLKQQNIKKQLIFRNMHSSKINHISKKCNYVEHKTEKPSLL